jgi:ATP-binding cassette subfamily F protein uup
VLREYVGGYDDWLRQRPAPAGKAPAAEAPKAERGARPRPAKSGLSFKEKKELEALPGQLEALETELSQLGTLLADGEVYRSDPQRVKTAQARYAELERLVAESYARWEDLEARAGA